VAGELFLTGLASGLDTGTIVERLMQLERRPLARLLAQQRLEEARRQALADIRSRLQELADAARALRDPTLWSDVQEVVSSDPAKVGASRVGGAAPGAYAISVTSLAGADQIRQGAAGANQASSDGALEISVDGKTVTVAIAAGDDLAAIAAKINAASGSPVYATVVSGRLYLSGKETGAAKTISVAAGPVSDELALSDAARAPEDHTIVAQDAAFTVNGVAYASATNTVAVVPGLSLVLKALVPAASPVTVTVGEPRPDREAVKAKLQAFVDRYNATVDFIRAKLSERRVTRPQSEADQRKGALEGDAGLASLLDGLRRALADPLSPPAGPFSSAAELGLSTGASSGSGQLSADAVAGKLVLDLGKLDEALTVSLEDVKAFLAGSAGSYGANGLGVRVDDLLAPWLRGSGGAPPILSARIDNEQALLDALARRRSELERRLSEREQALRAQFAALETVLQQAQSQGLWLAAQVERLTGSRAG
jgi:flagellar hook-associated protein 2